MSFPEYSEYLDSKVQWIGLLPSHWEAAPLKWQLIANDGGVWGSDPEEVSDTEVLRSTDQTVDGKWRVSDPAKRFLTSKEKVSAALKAGDLVVTKSSGSSLHIGKTTLVTSEMELKRYCYGNFMQRLRVKKSLLPVVLWYLMNNQICRKQLDLLSNSTTGLANLNGSLLGELLIPVAPIEEQTQIARFLDHETAKIDALIREQERLIELLQEKRQAVISHTVTKGLDPDVPMKDSGVEWLGEVPAHWKVVRLKHVKSHRPNAFVDGPFGSNLKSSHFIEEGDAYVIESNFATTGRLENTKLKQISLEHFRTIQRSETQGGDIIIAKIGARYGMCSILPTLDKPAVVSGNSLKLTINQDICDPIFATLVLRYLRERGAIEDIVNMTAQPALSLGELNNLPFPLPSLAEQNEILVSVQGQLTKFTSLTEECSRVIHLLYERRSALISAAVTGKIDVRNWEPPADESAFGEEVRQAGMEATA